MNKLLNFLINYSIQKIRNGSVIENLFPEKMIRDLLESHHFLKFGMQREKKVQIKIKFVKCTIFLCFKFFSWKIIFPLSN